MGYHYTMDAFCWLNQIVKDQEHRVRIELTQPLYESGVIPLDHQCYSFSEIGGYRTHIDRIKSPVHYLVCHNPICALFSESARKESNLRPSSYKDAARTIELHAEQVRPVGFEPTLCDGKASLESPLCYRYTTTS